MEATKRKYTKKNNEGKITVKHYLNTKLKPVLNHKSLKDGKERYPLYILISVIGQKLYIKSKYINPIAVDEFDNFFLENKEFINNEVRRITEIIKRQDPFTVRKHGSFDIKMVNYVYGELTLRLDNAIEILLKNEIIYLLMKDYDLKRLDQKKYKLSIVNQDVKNINLLLFAGTDWKNSSSQFLIKLFVGYEVNLNLGREKMFKNLESEYYELWDFIDKFQSADNFRNMEIEPTTIEWIESNYVQDIIRKSFVNEAKKYIEQIDSLLKKDLKSSYGYTEQ